MSSLCCIFTELSKPLPSTMHHYDNYDQLHTIKHHTCTAPRLTHLPAKSRRNCICYGRFYCRPSPNCYCYNTTIILFLLILFAYSQLTFLIYTHYQFQQFYTTDSSLVYRNSFYWVVIGYSQIHVRHKHANTPKFSRLSGTDTRVSRFTIIAPQRCKFQPKVVTTVLVTYQQT